MNGTETKLTALLRGPGPMDTEGWRRMLIVQHCTDIIQWALAMLNTARNDNPKFSPTRQTGKPGRDALQHRAGTLIGRLGGFALDGDDFDFTVMYRIAVSLNTMRDAEAVRAKRAEIKHWLLYSEMRESSARARAASLAFLMENFQAEREKGKETRWGFASETYETFEKELPEKEAGNIEMALVALDVTLGR